MNRVMAGAVGLLTVLALAGCAQSGNDVVYEPDTVSLGDALGATGAVLLIPVAVGLLLFFLLGIDYEYGRKRSDNEKKIGRAGLIGASVVLGIIVILWLAAIWSGLGGN